MRVFSAVDLKLVLAASLLVLLGTLILSSVSPSSFPIQFFHIFLAALVFLFFANMDIRILREISPWLYPISLFLLLLTIAIGAVTRGSVRWIGLGPFTLQASEVVKPLLLLFFAGFLTKSRGSPQGRRFFLSLLLAAPLVFLILVQPDLGSALVVLAGFLGVLFVSGVPLYFLAGGLVSAAAFSPIIWTLLAPYQKERILSFLNPTADPLGAGYNSIQAMIAVGSGGFLGRGLGQGSQSQLAFLPERHTDFIFAALSEELGFVAATIVVVAFAFILTRIVFLIKDISDSFSQAFLGGAFLTIFAQASINIGMNLGILPITGIPLPFVSVGGSSLVSMAAILGIVSAISGLKDRRGLGILREQ